MLNYGGRGLAAFSRYQENYLKQVEKAFGPLTSANRLVTAAWRDIGLGLAAFENCARQVERTQRMLNSLTAAPRLAAAMWQQAFERVVYPAREMSRSVERVRRILEPFERVRRILEPFETTVNRLGYVFPVSDLAERWRSIHIAAFPPSIRWIEEHYERLRLLPFYLAWRALQEGDRETVDYFLAEWCDMPRPTPEAYMALWNVLREGYWRRAENPAGYVKTAVWWQIKKQLFGDRLLAEELDKRSLEVVSLDNLPESGGRLWTPAKEDGIQAVEERLLIEWVLKQVKDPHDREALLAYCLGYAETLRDAFGGDKNKQDAARRRFKKLAEQLGPLLFN